MSKVGDRLRQRYRDQIEARSAPATQADVRRLRQDLNRGMRSDPNRVGTRQAAQKTIRMVRRGFSDIGKSLNTPSASGHRPKISQMPGSRRQMGISRQMDLSRLKTPGMQRMSLTWAPGQKKRRRR